MKLTDVSEVHTASIIIALTMEAVRTSVTSVNYNVTTRRYIPENSKLHTRRHENLKSSKSRATILIEVSRGFSLSIQSEIGP
jgi:hypothetical protein